MNWWDFNSQDKDKNKSSHHLFWLAKSLHMPKHVLTIKRLHACSYYYQTKRVRWFKGPHQKSSCNAINKGEKEKKNWKNHKPNHQHLFREQWMNWSRSNGSPVGKRWNTCRLDTLCNNMCRGGTITSARFLQATGWGDPSENWNKSDTFALWILDEIVRFCCTQEV